MIGNSVWVVNYCDKDFLFCDCNGVYASKERAIAAIENNFHRNEGYWVNRILLFDMKSSRCEIFYYKDIRVEVYMYETEIQ